MGDDSTFATGGIICTAGWDGEWHELGQLADAPNLTIDGDNAPGWHVAVPPIDYSETITLSTPWWFDGARVVRLILGDQYPASHLRPRWTIRMLRRGGKSHRGKHA